MSTATRPLLYASLGRASRRWLYRDLEAHVVGAVLRWETEEGKKVRPAALIDGKWREAAMPEPRPLYRLPELLADPDLPLLVVEGEPAADAALEALEDAVVVTTWAGGCGAVSKADWSPLEGRVVRVWPDADEPGQKAARSVAGHAHHVGAARIERLRVPGDWPEGHDAADLAPGAVRELWADPSRWEELDVAGALARHRARERAEARRQERRRHRWSASEPSPEWEITVKAARSLTVEDVVRRLGCGDPVKRGRQLAVRCPLHEDSRPSLTFDPGGSVWFCFPCGEGGDALELYMRVRRLDFADAVRELASNTPTIPSTAGAHP